MSDESSVELRAVLEEIAEAIGLDVDVDVEEDGDLLTGRFEGEDVGPLIGRHGQTIDAIQHLAQRIVFKSAPAATRIVVDAGGYRERRSEALCRRADGAAEEAVREHREVALDPMPAADRRVVHEHLRERGDVSTHSEGDEPERYLVIAPLGG